jgi:SAM-dependent methyltransferase
MGNGDWTHDFFSGPWLAVQRLARTPEQSAEEADFIARTLELSAGAEVLDAPCGDCRIGVELAARRIRVTGVDIQPELIEDARAKAAARGVSLELRVGDMRELPWRGRFDAALCWWGSFGWFNAEENLRQAKEVAHALKPGGRWLVDLPTLEALLPRFAHRNWHRVGDVLVCEESEFDPTTGRIDTLWTFRRDDETAVRHSSIHLYTYRELVSVLETAGFREFDAKGTLDGEPFRRGSRRLYLTAHIPG